MFSKFQSKKKFVATILLSMQMLTLASVPLFVPTHVAYAAEVVDNLGPEGLSPSTAGATPAKPPKSLGGWIMDNTVGALLAGIGFLFFQVAGKFCQLMAYVLDMAIDKTIDKATYSGLNVIQVGWTAIRDISNMFFIFVLLYIAILTILGLAGSNTKRWVAHLIIAAVLINFSLFATQVVVDAGNILTKGFWSQMKTNQASGTVSGFAPIIFEGLKAQTIFNTSGTDFIDDAKVFFGGALIMFIAGYVLLAGAIMMIIRTVTLLILMIVSPFAFLGFGLPKGGGFATMWLNKLLGATFVAPVFVMMLYINMMIIRSTDIVQFGGAGGSQFSSALTGEVNNFAIFYNFFIMIVLLLASLTVSQSVSNGVGAKASGWAKAAIGGGAGAAFAGAAVLGRQSFGRRAQNRLKDEKYIEEQNRLVAKGGMSGRLANLRLARDEKLSKGSFDIRNAPMKGLGVTAALGAAGISTGQGSKKSFATHGSTIGALTGEYRGTENEKNLIQIAKDRFPNDPVLQKAYLEQRGVDLGATRNKETQARINRDTLQNEAKTKLSDSIAQRQDLEARKAKGKIDLKGYEAEGAEIAKGVKEAMMKLSTNERAQLAEKHKGNSDYIENLTKGDLAAIHKLELEGKYSDPVLQDISKNAMRGNNVQLQKYLMTPDTQDKLFMVNYEQIQGDQNLMKNYERNKERITNISEAQELAMAENTRSNRTRELLGRGASLTPKEADELKNLLK